MITGHEHKVQIPQSSASSGERPNADTPAYSAARSARSADRSARSACAQSSVTGAPVQCTAVSARAAHLPAWPADTSVRSADTSACSADRRLCRNHERVRPGVARITPIFQVLLAVIHNRKSKVYQFGEADDISVAHSASCGERRPNDRCRRPLKHSTLFSHYAYQILDFRQRYNKVKFQLDHRSFHQN